MKLNFPYTSFFPYKLFVYKTCSAYLFVHVRNMAVKEFLSLIFWPLRAFKLDDILTLYMLYCVLIVNILKRGRLLLKKRVVTFNNIFDY